MIDTIADANDIKSSSIGQSENLKENILIPRRTIKVPIKTIGAQTELLIFLPSLIFSLTFLFEKKITCRIDGATTAKKITTPDTINVKLIQY